MGGKEQHAELHPGDNVGAPEPENNRQNNVCGQEDPHHGHKHTWYGYYLDQAVGLYGVATVITSMASQYLEEKGID